MRAALPCPIDHIGTVARGMHGMQGHMSRGWSKCHGWPNWRIRPRSPSSGQLNRKSKPAAASSRAILRGRSYRFCDLCDGEVAKYSPAAALLSAQFVALSSFLQTFFCRRQARELCQIRVPAI